MSDLTRCDLLKCIDMIHPVLLTVSPPLYLLTAEAECYKCERPQTVIAMAAAELADPDATEDPPVPSPAVLNYVTDLPRPLLAVLTARAPQYRMHYSVMASFDYYMNQCECGATFGDHYLTEQPGGAFMPLYDGDTDTLAAERLPLTEAVRIGGRYGPCTPDLTHLLKAVDE